jgi:hypothetical protein
MRSPSESPKTTMNSALEITGATIVCVHSFKTRATSRPLRAINPRWAASRAGNECNTVRARNR